MLLFIIIIILDRVVVLLNGDFFCLCVSVCDGSSLRLEYIDDAIEFVVIYFFFLSGGTTTMIFWSTRVIWSTTLLRMRGFDFQPMNSR